jgi:hypothetical protein
VQNSSIRHGWPKRPRLAARLYAEHSTNAPKDSNAVPVTWDELDEEVRQAWIDAAGVDTMGKRFDASVEAALREQEKHAEVDNDLTDEVRELTKRDLMAYDIDPTQWAQGYYDGSKDIKFADLDAWMAHTAMWFNRAINAARANEPVPRRVGKAPELAMPYGGEEQRKLDLFDPATLAVPSLPVKREDTLHGAVDDLRVPY